MPDQATLVVVHCDPKNQDLKNFAKKAAAANKGHKAGAKFLTFMPMDGHKDVAYVWFPHESHSELEPGAQAAALSDAHGPDDAHKMVAGAKAGVKKMGRVLMSRTAGGHRTPGKIPPYLVTYGLKVDPAKADDFKDAAKAFVDANAKSAHPVSFGVHRPSDFAKGERLVVLGIDSLSDLDASGSLNKQRLADHLGHDKAKKVGDKLRSSLKGAHRQVLRYMPEYSHA